MVLRLDEFDCMIIRKYHDNGIWKSGDLKEAQEIYSHNGSGRFKKWVEEEYGMNYNTAFGYIQAYETLAQLSGCKDDLTGQINREKIINSERAMEAQKLGVYKLSSLSKLPIEKQKYLIENAPLEKMIISYITWQIHKTLKIN